MDRACEEETCAAGASAKERAMEYTVSNRSCEPSTCEAGHLQ